APRLDRVGFRRSAATESFARANSQAVEFLGQASCGVNSRFAQRRLSPPDHERGGSASVSARYRFRLPQLAGNGGLCICSLDSPARLVWQCARILPLPRRLPVSFLCRLCCYCPSCVAPLVEFSA